MGGEGFMSNANTSLKNNRRTQKSRLEKFVNNTSNNQDVWEDPKKATPEQLTEIRTRLQLENKKIRQKKIAITTIILVVLIISFWIVNQIL